MRVDFEDRAELLAADPEVYYVTDHYVEYPIVLVRLSRVHRDALGELLQMAHGFVAAEKRQGGALRTAKRRTNARRPRR